MKKLVLFLAVLSFTTPGFAGQTESAIKKKDDEAKQEKVEAAKVADQESKEAKEALKKVEKMTEEARKGQTESADKK